MQSNFNLLAVNDGCTLRGGTRGFCATTCVVSIRKNSLFPCDSAALTIRLNRERQEFMMHRRNEENLMHILCEHLLCNIIIDKKGNASLELAGDE